MLTRLLPILIFVLTLPFQAHAGKRTVTLTTGEWPPYISEDLPQQGGLTQIVRRAFQASGLDCTVDFYPWARALSLVQKHKVDASFAWHMTDERQKYALASDPIMQNKTVVFYSRRVYPNGIKPLHIWEMGKYRVVGVRSYWYQSLLLNAGIQIHLANSDRQAMGMLLEGRGDLLILGSLAGWSIIRKYYPENIDNFAATELISDAVSPLYVLFPKDSPDAEELRKLFNQGLRTIRESGDYDTLMKQYGLFDPPDGEAVPKSF